MEHVQIPLLPCTKGSGLTEVQECTQDIGSKDLVILYLYIGIPTVVFLCSFVAAESTSACTVWGIQFLPVPSTCLLYTSPSPRD